MREKIGNHAIFINEDSIKTALGIETLSIRFRNYSFPDRLLHGVSSWWKLPIAMANRKGRITLFREYFSQLIHNRNNEKIARILAHESHHVQEFEKCDQSRLRKLCGKDEEEAAKKFENAWEDFLPYFHIYSEEDLLKES